LLELCRSPGDLEWTSESGIEYACAPQLTENRRKKFHKSVYDLRVNEQLEVTFFCMIMQLWRWIGYVLSVRLSCAMARDTLAYADFDDSP
jgi:hypothetical protein